MYYSNSFTVLPFIINSVVNKFIIPLAMGEIEYIDVEIPPGCVGLVEVWIKYHTVQIVPYNLTGVLKGDGRIFTLPLHYNILDAPYELECFIRNNDDTYAHTINVGVMLAKIQPSEYAILLGDNL